MSEKSTQITNCARCKNDHTVEFKPFTHPIEISTDGYETILRTYTHWALCPINGEPIIMHITEE